MTFSHFVSFGFSLSAQIHHNFQLFLFHVHVGRQYRPITINYTHSTPSLRSNLALRLSKSFQSNDCSMPVLHNRVINNERVHMQQRFGWQCTVATRTNKCVWVALSQRSGCKVTIMFPCSQPSMIVPIVLAKLHGANIHITNTIRPPRIKTL